MYIYIYIYAHTLIQLYVYAPIAQLAKGSALGCRMSEGFQSQTGRVTGKSIPNRIVLRIYILRIYIVQ